MHLREVGLEAGPALVVTDETVGPLYLDAVCDGLATAGWRPHALSVPAGEGSKSLERVGALYDGALELGISRRTPVLALGGGVVGDLAGFAAATLLRGLPLVQLPTTVIAQVDSAIGGKTGVNHAAGKNLVGAFHQPRLVLADPAALAHAPRARGAERAGRGRQARARRRRRARWTAWRPGGTGSERRGPRRPRPARPRRGRRQGARVVAADEREAGERAVLNFGHTFGHAVEREAGYGRFTHGEAVAAGDAGGPPPLGLRPARARPRATPSPSRSRQADHGSSPGSAPPALPPSVSEPPALRRHGRRTKSGRPAASGSWSSTEVGAARLVVRRARGRGSRRRGTTRAQGQARLRPLAAGASGTGPAGRRPA